MPGRARLLPPRPGPLASLQLNYSRSLGAGPYQEQPLSWHWQVGWDDLLVPLPFHQAPLWNAPRQQDPVSLPDFCLVIGLLVRFTLGKEVVESAWWVASQNLRLPLPPGQPWVDLAMKMPTPLGQRHTFCFLPRRSLARACPGGQELGWWGCQTWP
jgi:hypothetical protein